MGPAGSGQHTKMANQIAIAGTLAGVCEAIAYARAVGLDVDEVLAAIGGGAAGSWQLANNGPKSAHRVFCPRLLHQALHQRHEHRAGRGAGTADLDLTVLHMVRDKYDELAAQGGAADEGTQALIKVIDK